MSFQISAGINVSEIDLTTIVPVVSASDGAVGGVFRWGPVEQRVLVDSETNLVANFGKPSNLNAETWLTAASFLGYGNRLHVSRAANTTGSSPTVTIANVVSGSATVNVDSTALLSAGMAVTTVTGGAIKIGTTIASVVNATHITLSSASAALATATSGSIFFVSNTAFNAIANTGTVANLETCIVKNDAAFASKANSSYDSDVHFVARYPGELGNSLKISVCATPNGYMSNVALTVNTYSFTGVKTVGGDSTNIVRTSSLAAPVNVYTATISVSESSSNGSVEEANTTALSAATTLSGQFTVTDKVSIGSQNMKILSISSPALSASSNTTNAVASFTLTFDDVMKQSSNVTIASNTTSNVITRMWEYLDTVDVAPGVSDYQLNFGNSAITDELHIIVTDEAGKITGVPGTVLETYRAVSRANDSKTVDGSKNYYKDIINDSSEYIYAINDISGIASDTAGNLVAATTDVKAMNFVMGKDGADESNAPMSLLASAYDQFASAEDVDISLVLTGKTSESTGTQLANYLIDNIAEVRKDCVVFLSPKKGDVVGKTGSTAAAAIVATRNTARSTSYAVMDSGYKYMYDRYNDVYRWIPLNGDIAGLCARSDATNDPWYSPAGINRGQIKNLIRLAYNPAQSERDTLYKAGVNPVVTFPGQGTILYGDKTLLSKPSAFDRINVRRLFIVLEKAIARASRTTLFEFNDAFTRSQFKNLLTPYLRDIQGRRGITDFLVVCDETNNTSEVIDRNEFVGDIYIKPARSINFIQLNFVAVRTGVAFSEVVGQF
jgi:phage tail sheath protein FI